MQKGLRCVCAKEEVPVCINAACACVCEKESESLPHESLMRSPALLLGRAGLRTLFPVLGITSRFRCIMSEAAKPVITQDKARNGMLTIAPGQEHTATFIGPIHGLGDTNMGWADAAHHLHTSSLGHVKFILPNAPIQPVTLNMGMSMPSWYDITSLDDRSNQECEGIEDARKMVNDLIQEELDAGIPLSRIVVGGFSQGGALALYAGLQYDGQLAGVCCMSGYLPKDHAFELSEAAKKTPVAHFHGTDDPTVKIEWARQSQEKLTAMGLETYGLFEYKGMGHSACPEEFADVEKWLQEVLP